MLRTAGDSHTNSERQRTTPDRSRTQNPRGGIPMRHRLTTIQQQVRNLESV